MNDLVKKNGQQAVAEFSPDDIARLRSGIAQSRASTRIAGGDQLLRMQKSGRWVIGQQDEPVQEGSEWAVDPRQIRHGWCCWSNDPNPSAKNELLDERMTSMFDAKPPMPEPIQGYPFKEQRTLVMKCLNGTDEGLQILFKTNSVGGMRTVDVLLAALDAQLGKDPGTRCRSSSWSWRIIRTRNSGKFLIRFWL